MAANAPANASSSQSGESSKTSSIYLPSIACDIVEIRVAKTMMFRVHENVLRQSPFFENALKPEWVDARAGKPIELEDDDPDAFAAYVQWLYSHQVDPTYHYLKWAKNYVLGKKMMDPEFQDDVLSAFMDGCRSSGFCACSKAICIIYKGTPEGSPARRLLVDFWRRSRTAKARLAEEDYARTTPADFVNDLLVALFEEKVTPAPKEKS